MEPDYPLWWGPIIGLATRYIREGYSREQIVAALERSPAYSREIRGDEERIATLAREFYDLAQYIERACRHGGINSPECKGALAQQYSGQSNYTQYGVKLTAIYRAPNGEETRVTFIVSMNTSRSINQLLSRVTALIQSGDLLPPRDSDRRVAQGGAVLSSLHIHDVRGGGFGNDVDVGLGETLVPIKTIREQLGQGR